MPKAIMMFLCVVAALAAAVTGLTSCRGVEESRETPTIPAKVVGTFAFTDESGRVVLNFCDDGNSHRPAASRAAATYTITGFLTIVPHHIPVTGTMSGEWPYVLSFTAEGAVSGTHTTYAAYGNFSPEDGPGSFTMEIERTRGAVTEQGLLYVTQVEPSAEEPDVYAGYFGEWNPFADPVTVYSVEVEWLMYNDGSTWIVDDSVYGWVTFHPPGGIDIDGTFNMAVPAEVSGRVVGTWVVDNGTPDPDRGTITGEKTGMWSYEITGVHFFGEEGEEGTDDYTDDPIAAEVYGIDGGVFDTGLTSGLTRTEAFWDDISDATPMCFYAALIPPDTDGDGMPDYWEDQGGLDPHDPADATDDPDADFWNNYEEYVNGTDPYSADAPPPAP